MRLSCGATHPWAIQYLCRCMDIAAGWQFVALVSVVPAVLSSHFAACGCPPMSTSLSVPFGSLHDLRWLFVRINQRSVAVRLQDVAEHCEMMGSTAAASSLIFGALRMLVQGHWAWTHRHQPDIGVSQRQVGILPSAGASRVLEMTQAFLPGCVTVVCHMESTTDSLLD